MDKSNVSGGRLTTAATCFLVGAFFASPILAQVYQNVVRKPVFSAANDFSLGNDGIAKTFGGGIACNRTYDFQQGKQTEDCLFVGHGAFQSIKSADQLSPAERARYDLIQKESCELAGGREGYEDACVGLKIS